MKPRQYIAIIFVLLFVVLAAWIGIRLMHPISVGTLEVKVTDLPADDTALQQWLTTQAAVKQTSVTRTASGLTVVYHIAGHDARDFSNTILDECKQLGYHTNGYSVHSEYNPLLAE